MRFLFLTQYFPPEVGAPQVRLGALVKELVRLGHEVEVVTAMPNYPNGRIADGYRWRLYRRETLAGATVHRVWLYAAMGAGLARLINYASFTLFSLLGLLRCKRPDYIFVESPPLFLSVPAYIAGTCWRRPFIFNIADLWPDSMRDMKLIGDGFAFRCALGLEKWSYEKAMFVNAITDGIHATLVEKKSVAVEKVLSFPNGVDLETYAVREPDVALARELGLDGKSVVLYAGTHGLAQGLDIVLDAMELLLEAPDVRMVLIGSGSDKPRLTALAAARGLSNMIFLPPREQEYVARLYSISIAGLASLRNLPICAGARPSKIFPAMACGKPVIYSGSGEGARLIEGAHAGLTTPPEDARSLADAIKTLAAKPKLADEMGRSGRAFVEQNLSWQMIVDKWLRELESRRNVRS